MFTKERTNVCKGVGVLLLLFHHMFMSVSLTESMTLWFSDPTVLANIAVGMRVCVWIFAFLSAYGLTCKYNSLPESGRRWFVPRQWLSLMKPFWLIFALTAVLYVILFADLMSVYHYNGFFLAFDIFAVSDMMHTPKLLGVFWYMCFAQLVIFCIPVLNSFCRRFGYLSIPIAFIIMQFMGDGISTYNGGSYLDYLVVVVCGVVVAQKSFLPHRRRQAALGAPYRFGRIVGSRRSRCNRAPSDGGAGRRTALAQRLQRRFRNRGLPAVRRVHTRQVAVKGAGVSRSILGADVPHPLRAQQLCAADHLSDPYSGGGLLHFCRRDFALVSRGALSENADPI